jgi:competence protein ComEC
MAVGVAFASLGGRRTPGWVYLLHAVTVMLAIDPTLVRDVAFQLSATATAGVIMVAPVLRDAALSRWGALQRPALAAVVETLATATGAAVAVLPVQVAAFERVSPWTIPANVAVAPLYEATVAVAALAGALGGSEVAAGALRETARFVPEGFLAVVQAFARLPAADVPVRAPLLAGLVFIAALLVGLGWLANRTTEAPALDPGHRTGLGATVALAAIAGGLWLAVLRPDHDLTRVTVLDVGQGLAILVQDAGRAVLIDAGPADGAVLHALPATGVRAGLDAVLLTHTDLDHTGGLAVLLPRLEVGAVLGDAAVLAAAGLDGSAVDIGDRVRLSERVSIEVLAPPVVTRGRAHASSNDASLVLLVTIGERRILLPADIEASAEAWLVESGQPVAADVLVVPHHGSRTSSTPAFVAAVAPSVAVVSAGAGNPFGHPLSEVLERYEGAAVLRTDLNGNVTLSSDGERLWWRTER